MGLPKPWQRSHPDKSLCFLPLSLLWRPSRLDRRDRVASQLEGRSETPDLDMVFQAMLGCPQACVLSLLGYPSSCPGIVLCWGVSRRGSTAPSAPRVWCACLRNRAGSGLLGSSWISTFPTSLPRSHKPSSVGDPQTGRWLGLGSSPGSSRAAVTLLSHPPSALSWPCGSLGPPCLSWSPPSMAGLRAAASQSLLDAGYKRCGIFLKLPRR